MRMLVCGGRDFRDYDRMDAELARIIEPYHHRGDWPPVVISGGARGADSLAHDWAYRNSFEFLEFPADWEKHGKAAGPIRNQQMIDEAAPDVVVAFPGGRGTADMVRRAKKAGIETIEILEAR